MDKDWRKNSQRLHKIEVQEKGPRSASKNIRDCKIMTTNKADDLSVSDIVIENGIGIPISNSWRKILSFTLC